MQNQFDILERKLGQLTQLSLRLRDDNRQLRQQLAEAQGQRQAAESRIELVGARLEALLQQLPGVADEPVGKQEQHDE